MKKNRKRRKPLQKKRKTHHVNVDILNRKLGVESNRTSSMTNPQEQKEEKNDDNNSESTTLIDAIQQNHTHLVLESLRLLLDPGHTLSTICNKLGSPALHIAIQHHNLPLVRCFVDYGVDINKQDPSGNTVFHILATQHALENSIWNAIFYTLLRNGGNRFLKNKEGKLASTTEFLSVERATAMNTTKKTIFESVLTHDVDQVETWIQIEGYTANTKNNQGLSLLELLQNEFTVNMVPRTDVQDVIQTLTNHGSFLFSL